jgi:hypothetical protein
MKKIQMKMMVAASLVAAVWHRHTQPDTVVLANSAPPAPPAPPAPNPDAGAAEELAQRNADEKLIRSKMAVGLTRDQAEAVVKRQPAFKKTHSQLATERRAQAAKAAGK